MSNIMNHDGLEQPGQVAKKANEEGKQEKIWSLLEKSSRQGWPERVWRGHLWSCHWLVWAILGTVALSSMSIHFNRDVGDSLFTIMWENREGFSWEVLAHYLVIGEISIFWLACLYDLLTWPVLSRKGEVGIVRKERRVASFLTKREKKIGQRGAWLALLSLLWGLGQLGSSQEVKHAYENHGYGGAAKRELQLLLGRDENWQSDWGWKTGEFKHSVGGQVLNLRTLPPPAPLTAMIPIWLGLGGLGLFALGRSLGKRWKGWGGQSLDREEFIQGEWEWERRWQLWEGPIFDKIKKKD